MLRLYIPIWGSVILAWVLMQTVVNPDNLPPDRLPYDPEHHTLRAVVRNAVTLFGTGSLNLPLWSLRWELLFSLLLPVYILAAHRITRPAWTAVALLSMLTVVGVGLQSGHESLQFMPMFMIGVVIAFRLDDVRGLCARLRLARPYAMPLMLAVGCLLATGPWTVQGLGTGSILLINIVTVGSVIGVAAIMVAAIVWEPFAAALSTAPARFLGTRSYSLYLVHVPVLTAITAAMGRDNMWLLLPVCLLTAFVVTEIFYRAVERPAHALARKVRTLICSPVDTPDQGIPSRSRAPSSNDP